MLTIAESYAASAIHDIRPAINAKRAAITGKMGFFQRTLIGSIWGPLLEALLPILMKLIMEWLANRRSGLSPQVLATEDQQILAQADTADLRLMGIRR